MFPESCFFQKQPPDVFFKKKGVIRNFSKFTGKHLCQKLFFKKETLAQVFSCEFCEISTNTFFTEHLWTTAFLIQPVTLFLLEMLINKKTRHFDSSLNHQEHLFHRTCYHQLFSSYEYCKVFKNSYFIEHLQKQSLANILQNTCS